MTKEILLQKLREMGIVRRGEITLRSGATSDIYCDVRMIFGVPLILNAVADEIGKMIPENATCVAASGYGGLPLASVVASRKNLKMIGVRDSAKAHGKSGRIAGYVPREEDSVMIIDDVLSTGSSIRETLLGLQESNAKVLGAVVAVSRTKADLPIPCASLYSIEELL